MKLKLTDNTLHETITSYLNERDEEEKTFVLEKIKLRQEVLTNKDNEIDKLQYERTLILNDICNTINIDLRNSSWNLFRFFEPNMFWKAWKYFHYKKDLDNDLKNKEITQEEYNSYKSSFGYTKDTVQRVFFGEDFKEKVEFKEVIGFWEVGYEYIFTYENQEIQIFIPNFNCDAKTYEYMLKGYHISYRQDECCVCYIVEDLDYNKVANKLQEWMKNEEWKTKDGRTQQKK